MPLVYYERRGLHIPRLTTPTLRPDISPAILFMSAVKDYLDAEDFYRGECLPVHLINIITAET